MLSDAFFPDESCLDLRHFRGILKNGFSEPSVRDSWTLIQRPVTNSMQLAEYGDHSISIDLFSW